MKKKTTIFIILVALCIMLCSCGEKEIEEPKVSPEEIRLNNIIEATDYEYNNYTNRMIIDMDQITINCMQKIEEIRSYVKIDLLTYSIETYTYSRNEKNYIATKTLNTWRINETEDISNNNFAKFFKDDDFKIDNYTFDGEFYIYVITPADLLSSLGDLGEYIAKDINGEIILKVKLSQIFEEYVISEMNINFHFVDNDTNENLEASIIMNISNYNSTSIIIPDFSDIQSKPTDPFDIESLKDLLPDNMTFALKIKVIKNIPESVKKEDYSSYEDYLQFLIENEYIKYEINIANDMITDENEIILIWPDDFNDTDSLIETLKEKGLLP